MRVLIILTLETILFGLYWSDSSQYRYITISNNLLTQVQTMEILRIFDLHIFKNKTMIVIANIENKQSDFVITRTTHLFVGFCLNHGDHSMNHICLDTIISFIGSIFFDDQIFNNLISKILRRLQSDHI